MCFDFSLDVRAVITRRNVNNDLLIMVACFCSNPVTPDFFVFSLPAKSTRFSLPIFAGSELPETESFCSIVMVNMQWDLDDLLLRSVSAMLLFCVAISNNLKISSGDLTV